MVKEQNKLLNGILGNIQDVSKALDLLSEHEVSAYIYLLLSERIFNPLTAKSLNIDHPSEFLKGAHAALSALGDIPDMIATLTKKN